MLFSITSNNIDITLDVDLDKMNAVDFIKLQEYFLMMAEKMEDTDTDEAEYDACFNSNIRGYWFLKGKIFKRYSSFNKSYYYCDPHEMKQGGPGAFERFLRRQSME